MAVNHLVFQGRLTKDIELRTTQSGIENVQFTLAWSEKYKETEHKCFMRCKAWRNTATFLDKYFHDKGTEMLVEGSLETEEWTDKDGNNRSQVVLNVDKVHFCGKKQQGGQDSTTVAEATPAEPTTTVPSSEEELPF